MDARSLRIKAFFHLIPLLILVCVKCSPAYAENIVKVGGAGTWLGVMKILGSAYADAHPGTKIEVMPNLGSAGGIKALLHRKLDVALSGREINVDERRDGAVAVECAKSPFLFIVNSSVKKSDVTTREMELIYKGQSLKWPDGHLIRVVLRPASDTDTKIMRSISKEIDQAVLESSSLKNSIFAVTDHDAIDIVEKTIGSIGGSTLVQLSTDRHQVHALSYNGAKPTLNSLKQGSYSLVKPLYLVTTATTSESAMKFIKFVSSEQGRTILTKFGALPVSVNKR